MIRVLQRATVIAVVVISAAAAGFSFYQHQARAGDTSPASTGQAAAGQDAALIGTARPSFSLPDLQGRQRHIRDWDGRVIALNFWATWCPPCLKEIPRLIKLQTKYGGRGLQIIGIALQKPAEVIEFAREHGMNYPLLAGELPVVRIAEDYGNDIGALPYTVVIDRQGRIAFIKRGPVTVSEMQRVLRPLL
jgi:peroxiredoxin